MSMRACGMRILLGPARFLMPKASSTEPWKIAHSFIDFYIERALNRMKDGKLSEDADSNNQISLLGDLLKQTTDKAEIRSQIVQAMMAAQDTTAALMSNVLFLLSRHKSVWERLRNETATINIENLNADSLRGLKLVRNTLNEG